MLQMTQVLNDGALAYYRGTPRLSNPYSFKNGWINHFKQKTWYKGYDEAKHEASTEKI